MSECDAAFKKFDSAKPRMDLLPPRAMQAMARVLTYGAEKYGANNWHQIAKEERYRYLAAPLRHIFAHLEGEENDPETDELHLAHAMCSLAFLTELLLKDRLNDGRDAEYTVDKEQAVRFVRDEDGLKEEPEPQVGWRWEERVLRPKGWGPPPTEEEQRLHAEQHPDDDGDGEWEYDPDDPDTLWFGGVYRTEDLTHGLFAKYEFCAIEPDGGPGVDIKKRVRVRPAGYGPCPTQEEWDAHGGRWLYRYTSQPRTWMTWVGAECPKPHQEGVEWCAVAGYDYTSNQYPPVEVVLP